MQKFKNMQFSKKNTFKIKSMYEPHVFRGSTLEIRHFFAKTFSFPFLCESERLNVANFYFFIFTVNYTVKSDEMRSFLLKSANHSVKKF